MLNRRSVALGGLALLAAGWGLHRVTAQSQSGDIAGDLISAGKGSGAGLSGMAESSGSKTFEIVKTDIEWQKQLTPLQYQVLRKHATERPFTSPLNKIDAPGMYKCAGCDLPLFSSETKYDSQTGWPSFWQPLENAIGTSTDYLIGYPRVEVHCRRCGGHLGHVFEDGPKPTGRRYCINGVAMTFEPASNKS